MRATKVGRAGLTLAGLAALVGCRPVLVNVPEPGHGVIGTGVHHVPELSDDGNVVAFQTSDYLTAEDGDGTWDIYARDLRAGKTALMSVGSEGSQDSCGSNNPAISGDGRYISWSGCSTIAGAPPPPGTRGTNVYVKDRHTGGLEQVGVSEYSGFSAGGFGFLDHDGSHIVMWCFPTPGSGVTGVCVQERATGETLLVSRRTGGEVVQAFAVPASITDDGNLVAFTAPHAAVAPGSTDRRQQLFVRDLTAGVTTPVAVDPAVLPGHLDGVVSGDGTAAVVWQIDAPYGVAHVDLGTGAVRRLDQRGCTDTAPSPSYVTATISDDGDVVAFMSGSDRLVAHDTNASEDVFVWRSALPCLVQRVSVGPRFQQGDGDSYWATVSGDGSTVAFVSEATNLVADDTNGAADAFVVRLTPRRR